MTARVAGLVLRALALAALSLALPGCLQHWRQSAGPGLGPKPPEALRVATHNVHYIRLNAETGAWSVADWEQRKGPLDAAFKTLDADLFAVQEMESFAGGHASHAPHRAPSAKPALNALLPLPRAMLKTAAALSFANAPSMNRFWNGASFILRPAIRP